MKVFIYSAIFFLILSGIVSPVSAATETNIQVSNNAEGSESHVSVNNVVNSSSTTTVQSSNNKSCVTINGKTQCYEGDVVINEGNAKVQINNQAEKSIKKATESVNVKPTIEQQVKAAQDKVAEAKKEMEQKIETQKNIIQKFFDMLKNLFSSVI